MRTLRLCASLPLLSLMALASAQAPAAAPAMQTFRDEALHFTFQYPSDFQGNAQLSASLTRAFAGQPGDADRAKMAKCLTVPLSAGKGFDGASPDRFGMLLMLEFDNPCLSVPVTVDTIGEVAQQLMKFLSAFGTPSTEDAVHYQLDGHEAYFVQGSAAAKVLGEGRMVHAAASCVLVKTNTVCWLLADTDHKLMPSLVASPVTFDGHPAVPLIPKDLTQPW